MREMSYARYNKTRTWRVLVCFVFGGPGSFELSGKMPISIGFYRMEILWGYRLGYTLLALALIVSLAACCLAVPCDAIHQCFRHCRLNA